jgi:hypothetical protein
VLLPYLDPTARSKVSPDSKCMAKRDPNPSTLMCSSKTCKLQLETLEIRSGYASTINPNPTPEPHRRRQALSPSASQSHKNRRFPLFKISSQTSSQNFSFIFQTQNFPTRSSGSADPQPNEKKHPKNSKKGLVKGKVK